MNLIKVSEHKIKMKNKLKIISFKIALKHLGINLIREEMACTMKIIKC